MSRNGTSPFLVLLVVGAVLESAIGIGVLVSRPAEVAVIHGVVTPPGADERINSDMIDAYMRAMLGRSGIPGAILAIVHDDRVLHTAGYGYTPSGAPVTTETPMAIASLSKSMTAAAMLSLVDDSLLDLDATVKRYVPEFELADPRGAEITVRQLMNQTSGLATRTLPPMPDGGLTSPTELLPWLREATLAAAPGAAFNYCNENYLLLSLVAERVLGQPFERLLDARLFGPAGMPDSREFFRLRDAASAIEGGSEMIYGIPVPWQVPDEASGAAGGVTSTAGDLAQWLLLNTNGGRAVNGLAVLSPAAVTAMHTASAPRGNYGFGWRIDVLPDATTNVHHSGIARAYTAHQSLFPAIGYGYSFVINGGHFFRVDAASLRYGLDAMMQGQTPNTGWPFSLLGLPLDLVADQFMLVLTAICLGTGIVATRRASRWAKRRADRSRFVRALGLAPYLAVVLSPLVLPWLLSVINRGERVPLGRIFAYWPPFGVLCIAAVLAALAVLTARIAALRSG
jgi:CubicO group peptidase (beta-lactamase class C family)